MTNWRPIGSAPKRGQEVVVRRVVGGLTTYEGAAVWRLASANGPEGWMDPVEDKPVPEPTQWKATGRGHPRDG
jgi:hypothetical protein